MIDAGAQCVRSCQSLENELKNKIIQVFFNRNESSLYRKIGQDFRLTFCTQEGLAESDS